jgi:hypothetical protein
MSNPSGEKRKLSEEKTDIDTAPLETPAAKKRRVRLLVCVGAGNTGEAPIHGRARCRALLRVCLSCVQLHAIKKKKQKERKRQAQTASQAALSTATGLPAPVVATGAFVTRFTAHKSTEAPSLGAAVKALRPASRLQIWDAETCLEELAVSRAKAAVPAIMASAAVLVTPTCEMSRLAAMSALRKTFTELCAKHQHLSNDPPIYGFGS